MRGPRRGRGAMLTVRGHLRRRLASRRGFPSARPGAGALLSDVGRTAPLLPNLGLGGGVPFPSRGWVPGLLAVTLASKVSELPGWDWELGARPPPLLLGPLTRGSAFERPAILSSPLQYLSVSVSLFLFHPKKCGEKGEPGPEPSLSLVTSCFGSRVLSYQLFIDSEHRFPLSGVWGVALKGSRRNGMPVTLALAWKGRMGDGDNRFFLLLPNHL